MNSVSDPSSFVLTTQTNVIVWKVDDEKTLTIIHQFNPNPETSTSIASVVAFQSDRENVPIQGGILMQFDYDFQSDRLTRFRGDGCHCLRERLEKIIAQQRETIANWWRMAKEKSKDDLERSIFDPELSHEGMIGYHELTPEVSTDLSKPTFPAGTIFIHNAARWWVTDMYCANPECHCHDTLFVFYPVHDLASQQKDTVCVDYILNKSYTIRDVDEGTITADAAHDLVKSWFANKPVWFTDAEITSRSKQLKRVMARTMLHRATHRTSEEPHARKIGRNEACPCGSGKKFKACCGKQ